MVAVMDFSTFICPWRSFGANPKIAGGFLRVESRGDRMGSVLALPWLWRQSWGQPRGCPDVTRAAEQHLARFSKPQDALLHPQVSEPVWVCGYFHGA